MRPSTSVNCFFDATFTTPVGEQITRLYDAGFRVLDMNFWDWCMSDLSPFAGADWRTWVEGIANTAERLGIIFTQAHAHVYNFFAEPDAEYKREIYARCIEAAALLNIPWTTYHPSQIPDYEADDMLERMIAGNYEFYAPLVERAEKLGTGIALENMGILRGGLTDAKSLSALIDRFGSRAVGACWDTGHAHIAGVDQAESIKTLGARLRALHVQDNDGVSDQHMPPYFGTIDWPALTGALRDISYKGDFTFEAHMIVRRVPEQHKALAARLLYNIGVELTGQDCADS